MILGIIKISRQCRKNGKEYVRFVYGHSEVHKKRLENKCKRTIFLRSLGFMRGFEDVGKPEPEKTTEGGPAKRVRSVRLEGEGFSTSAGTWKNTLEKTLP